MQRYFLNKVVWITGASSGIGEAVAYSLAAQGARLILTSSSEEKLLRVADRCREHPCKVHILCCDLSLTPQLPDLVERAWRIYGCVDILFNNAGISQRGSVIDTRMEVLRKVMELDFFAPVELTRAILPLMIRSGGGQLVTTTSIAGRFGFPLRGGYSAAKHALYGFFETVEAEYHGQGIRVTMVCPGRVNTAISMNALESDGSRHGLMDPGQAQGISSEKAARIILRAVSRRKREVLVGGRELLMVPLKRLCPSLCARLARKVSQV